MFQSINILLPFLLLLFLRPLSELCSSFIYVIWYRRFKTRHSHHWTSLSVQSYFLTKFILCLRPGFIKCSYYTIRGFWPTTYLQLNSKKAPWFRELYKRGVPRQWFTGAIIMKKFMCNEEHYNVITLFFRTVFIIAIFYELSMNKQWIFRCICTIFFLYIPSVFY